ncbi:alpha/beta-Hydrolases superfamily protein [Euphorbia peplus]|nr:alpha/beta-Hydrolases superfamily protein [Euphorbia peplus]
MDSNSTAAEVAFEIPSICRLYKDGIVQRFIGTEIVLPSPESEIKSKDVIHSSIYLQSFIFINLSTQKNAPENPLPAAYEEDAWTSLNWVASHSNRDGQEDWLNRYADLRWVFVAGDSAGVDIAHNLGMRIGVERLKFGSFNVLGIVIAHPFFGGKLEAIEGESKDPKKRSIG